MDEELSKEVKQLGFPIEHKHKLCCLRQELIDSFVDARYMMFIKYAAFHLQHLNMKKDEANKDLKKIEEDPNKNIADKEENAENKVSNEEKEATKEEVKQENEKSEENSTEKKENSQLETEEAKKIVESITDGNKLERKLCF